MKRSSEEQFLVIAPQGLGDSLEATPLVRALRLARPAARIDVVVTRDGPKLLFESLPEYVDDVLYLPYWEGGAWAFVRAIRLNRRRRYNLSYLVYPSARPVYEFLSAAFPARRRIAHRHAPRMLLDLPWLRATLVPVRKIHNVERNRDLLRASAIKPDGGMGYLVPRAWIAAPHQRHPERIAVHVGSIAHSKLALKRWPVENFVALCRRLVHNRKEVVLIIGPAELQESLAVLRGVPELGRFEGALPELARFLSGCALVVANDSGVAHLAAGVGAPVVALFGPTPLEYAPFAPSSTALRPSDCPPCFDVRRPVVRCVRGIDFRCLKQDLTVDLVARAIADALGEKSADSYGSRRVRGAPAEGRGSLVLKREARE